jgi:hypothetical protein
MRLCLILLFISQLLKAQIDSAMNVPMVGIHLGAHLPGGDLAQRFGGDLALGGSFMFKTKKNWIVGVESNYFFGRNVKIDVLSQMRSEDGRVIDNEGFPADLRVTERGMAIQPVFGKVFKWLSANPNSGLMVTVGAGYIQHKIKLYDAQHKIAAVKDELAYGYDRLTSGFSTSQFIGYLFLGENRMTNFYFGLEAYQCFTKSVRKLNYDTGLPDTKSRLDLLFGFRFGWILPLYKRKPYNYYYN